MANYNQYLHNNNATINCNSLDEKMRHIYSNPKYMDRNSYMTNLALHGFPTRENLC